MKTISKLMFLLLFVSIGYSQVRSISGTIRNAATLEPLPYANVVIKDTYLGGTSNIDGYYFVSGLRHDSLIVVFSYMGYVPKTETLHYQGESHIILPIALQPRTLGGEEVLVEDSLLLAPEFVLETQVPDENPIVSEITTVIPEDVEIVGFEMDLYAPMPRLSSGVLGSQVLIEGVPVLPTRHLFHIYPAYNLDAVKHIAHFSPGKTMQSRSPYREVTELVYKEGNRSNFDLSGKLGLVESSLTTSGPHAAGSWYFSGRRADFDGIYSMSEERSDSVYNRFMPDYYFYDLNGKVTLDLSDHTKAAITAFRTYDKLHWLGDQGVSAHSSWYTKLMSARIQHRFTPQMSTAANIYSMRYYTFFRANDISLGQNLTLDGDLKHDLRTLGIRSVTDYYLSKNNTLQLGVGFERLATEFSFVDSNNADIPNAWVTSLDAYYSHPLPFNLNLGIGFNGVGSKNITGFTLNPEADLTWSPSNVLSAHVQIIGAKPQIREISFSNTMEQPVFDVMLPVDESLSAPEILSVRMGADIVPVVGYDISAEFFTEKHKAPVLMDANWLGDISDQSDWLMEYDEAVRSGMDLSIEKRTMGLHARFEYRFQKGTLTDVNGGEFDLLGERNHTLGFELDGHLGERSGYDLKGRLASGRHYLNNTGGAAVSDLYHRLDASIYRDLNINEVNGRLTFSLHNVTNAENTPLSDGAYSPITPEERVFALLPFMPTVNLCFNF